MVSVSEATSIIQSQTFTPSTETVRLEQSLGRVLAEKVFADRDFPPFDRVAMDGIAFRFESWKKGQTQFNIESMAAAGQPQQILNDGLKCIEVMTGAPLPAQTDTVVRYEDLVIDNGIATLQVGEISARQNIHPQGQDAQSGQVLLTEGAEISAAEIALMASIGMTRLKVKAPPRFAVISTGDELVDIKETPLPHQIRRSNAYALASELDALKCPVEMFHLKDNEEDLASGLSKALADHDVLVLSGGVSQGKFDFVPSTLELLGIQKRFHKVSQKPGKPFWFGVGNGKTVFALPGNPVSTFMCFHRYIKPWLKQSMGVNLTLQTAILAEPFTFKPELTYFLQVSVKNEGGKLMAYPLPGGGSGDFANLKEVDGFLELPADQTVFMPGNAFPYYPFRK
ncbi:MAG: molybdopterin molybdotransferase MoeA [Cyclobacteriaceae bacterium]